MNGLLILLGMTLTASGGDPAWDALERLRQDLATRSPTAETFSMSEQDAEGIERQSFIEIDWRLPEMIVLRKRGGREVLIDAKRAPQGYVAVGLYHLLLRSLPALSEEYSVRLRPGRPGEIALEMSRESGRGPRRVNVRCDQQRGRPVEFEVVGDSGERYRLWSEKVRPGFERQPVSF